MSEQVMTRAIASAVGCPEWLRRGGSESWCVPLDLQPPGAWSVKTPRLLQAQQAFAHHEEVGQRAGDHEAMPVLCQAAVNEADAISLGFGDSMADSEDAGDHIVEILSRSITAVAFCTFLKRILGTGGCRAD